VWREKKQAGSRQNGISVRGKGWRYGSLKRISWLGDDLKRSWADGLAYR